MRMPVGATCPGIVAWMLRFFLLRFLPRRLVPILLVLDVIRLIRNWRSRNRPAIAPPAGRRTATADEGKTGVTATNTWTDRTD
jgi:hypothetical protein